MDVMIPSFTYLLKHEKITIRTDYKFCHALRIFFPLEITVVDKNCLCRRLNDHATVNERESKLNYRDDPGERERERERERKLSLFQDESMSRTLIPRRACCTCSIVQR